MITTFKTEGIVSLCRIADQTLPEDIIPLVSIVCITFNHAKFITACLDGFLSQETTFPVEIIVHDDASTDGTKDIIICYSRKHPSVIRPILQDENQYSKGNKIFELAWRHARGKYIAMCDGDDYWIDSSKLQVQIEFLESNPDFSICFHKVTIYESGRLLEDYITRPKPGTSSIVDLANGNYIHTCSCVFRNRGVTSLGPNYKSTTNGDYYIHFMNAQFGYIFCFDKVMAVYRVHSGAIWSKTSRLYRVRKTQSTRRAILEDLERDDSVAFLALTKRYLQVECSIRSNNSDPPPLETLFFSERQGYTHEMFAYLCETREELESAKDTLERRHNSISFCTKRALTLLANKLLRFFFR